MGKRREGAKENNEVVGRERGKKRRWRRVGNAKQTSWVKTCDFNNPDLLENFNSCFWNIYLTQISSCITIISEIQVHQIIFLKHLGKFSDVLQTAPVKHLQQQQNKLNLDD